MSGSKTATLGTEDLPFDGADALPRGTLVDDRYEIVEWLGSGGYAVVYRALDRHLHREVALKLLRRDRVSASALARFRREVNVAREAVSARLVRVFDLGGDDAPYLTMELVARGSLRHCIPTGGMAVEEAVRTATQIVDGLAALHALNIVHRDVKPENILIDAEGDVKLADFGLARYLDEEHSRATMTGAIVGTSEYLSPEQALGTSIDARSDLYAFGLVLFEMLTGARPFARESTVGTMLARLRTPAPAVRSIRREVPLWLSSIVARLLRREPSDRYASAADVLRALRKRRADLRTAVPWRRVMAGVVAAGAIGAALLVPRLATPKPRNIRFARMETRGFTAIAAMSKNGETLWQKTDVDSDAASQVALARIEPNQPPLLAAIFAKRRNYLPDGGRQMLLLLDPDTGEVRRRVKLPSPGPLFGYSDRYHVRTIHAVDLDHDGIDEIIVSYSHAPEAPGVVVLYEPKLNRARIVFEGEGGHVFAMAQDLDGDGRPELLLAGINNGFDWINAMTAIRIRPWIGETVEPGAASNDEMLYSPQRAGWNDANLLWYALLPRGQMPVSPTALQWDDARKQISIEYLDGRKVVLTRDGFRVDEPSTLAPTKRQELRRAAYAHYRECVRLLAGEFFDAAVDEITKAVDDAQNANDAVLVEAMQRIQGRALILGGRAAEGEALMRGIAKNSENASEIAYDTAVAFHLAGDLDRALRWYETGYGHGAARNFGKSKHEFIQGIVFVLCERREWARADEAMTRFRESFLFEHKRDWASMYGEFIRWRAGETPKFDDLDVNSFTIDVMRYWKLEFRNQRGEDPAELMKGVEEEIAVDSAPRSGLWSLKAELLERLGRPAEAAEAMRRAWDFSRVDRKSSIVAHAHVPIVAERLKRLARVEGR